LLAAGCSGLLGFSDYTVVEGSGDAGPETSSEASNEAATDGGADGQVNCNVDLTLQCYPCTPTVTEQFLNGCTDGTCVPFDKTRLAPFLSADGGLPALPVDGG
jgi:hypothetical protein